MVVSSVDFGAEPYVGLVTAPNEHPPGGGDFPDPSKYCIAKFRELAGFDPTGIVGVNIPKTASIAEIAQHGMSIVCRLPEASASVSICVHDIRGRLVKALAHGPMSAGTHHFYFDGRGSNGRVLTSGRYLCTVQTGKTEISKPVTVYGTR
jgi:hypothetical protein